MTREEMQQEAFRRMSARLLEMCPPGSSIPDAFNFAFRNAVLASLDIVDLALTDPQVLACAVAKLPKSARDAMRVFVDACENEGLDG